MLRNKKSSPPSVLWADDPSQQLLKHAMGCAAGALDSVA
jgi:hypothetical protein